MKCSRQTLGWLGAGALMVSLTVLFLTALGGCANGNSAAHAKPDKKSNPPNAGSGQTVRVKVVHPKRESLRRVSSPHPAHVEPYEKTDIHAMVSGYLEAIASARRSDGEPILDERGKPRPWDIGDRVKKGQVLATLWAPEMKQDLVRQAALVAKARADVGQAEAASKAAEALVAAAEAKVDEISSMVAKYDADVHYRKGEYQRYAQLASQRAVQSEIVDREHNHLRSAEAALASSKSAVRTARSNAEVQKAKLLQAVADEKAAEARLRIAQANQKHTQIMLDYATIKAPYDGVITRRLVDTGAFIRSATSGMTAPIFTVARVDRLRIVAQIPEADAALVKIGQPANFLQNAGRGQRVITGKIVRIADALDPDNRTMRVEMELEGKAAELRPGVFGSMTLTLVNIADALTLPSESVLTGVKPRVLCVQNGRVVQREISVGYTDGIRVQVTGGLTQDSQVIANGNENVREGQTVEIIQ